MNRSLKVAAVVVLVLAVLLGVADRVSAHYAESAIRDRVAAKLAAEDIESAPPEVTITGIPFLTQVASGNYDEIKVNLRDVKVGSLPIPLLEVRAFDVRASASGLMEGTEEVVATRVDGVATLSYASLVEASGLEGVTLSGDGQVVRISGEVPLAGELTGAAKVTVVDGRVRIQVTELTAANAGDATQQIIDRYRQRLGAATFRLPEMPFRLRLVSVEPGHGGLKIGMSADEVTLT